MIYVARAALLIIDMQRDFVDPDGPVPTPGARDIVPRIKKLSDEARACGVPVIYVQEVLRHQGVDFGLLMDGVEPVHCVEGTSGVEIVEQLTPHKEDCLVVKRRYDSFLATDLEILLKGLRTDTLYITGVATDVCVQYTAAHAHQLDFRVRVVEDCVAGTDSAAHRAALAAIERLQAGSIVQSSRTLKDFRDMKE